MVQGQAGMLEGFITLVLVGGVMAIGIAIMAGAYASIVRWDKHKYLEIKKERVAALQVYNMVLKNVEGDLPLTAYSQALKYTIRKYHLGDHGRIEFHGSEKWYLAELIIEAVNQNRISLGTLAIAQADMELSADNQIKLQEEFTA
jgi:hypothetical protein